jgi:NADH-quinone oxidoreductase subunit D
MLVEEPYAIEEGEFVINMGPQHPATHGVLHLKVTLDGETIKNIEPHLGYVHRSIEKMCESLSYRQFILTSSRLDYLSAHMNNQACALAVEKAMQVEAPPRAKAIRILMAELTRLASHQLWWACMGLDLGAVTPFFYAFREREAINEIMEETCGARLTMNYMVPGGVMQDIHPDFVKKVKAVVKQVRDNFHEYDELLTGNVIFQQRLKGVGYLSYKDARNYGCTGPTARGSGLNCDVRKLFPYDGYEKLSFNEAISFNGDCWSRYLVRLEEIKQSLAIIDQLIENIPEGDYQAKTKALIKLPKGEYWQSVETARGEFGVYIVSEGAATPYRCKFRSPNLSNLSAIPQMARGAKIGDLVAIMATVDLVIPDIDR